MLDTWEQAMVDDVIAQVDDQPTDPRAKVQHLFDLAPSADFAVELAIRDWSRRDRAVATRLRRIDNRRLRWLGSLFRQFCTDENDVDARAMLAYSLLIGSYFIAAPHGTKSRSQMLQLALDRLVGESWD
jgi:hypothetical protein